MPVGLIPDRETKGDIALYLRLVWGKLRPGTWVEYERHYHERVAVSSNGVNGLRERQLLRSTEDPDEGVSVRVWDSLDDLLNYERKLPNMIPFKLSNHIHPLPADGRLYRQNGYWPSVSPQVPARSRR